MTQWDTLCLHEPESESESFLPSPENKLFCNEQRQERCDEGTESRVGCASAHRVHGLVLLLMNHTVHDTSLGLSEPYSPRKLKEPVSPVFLKVP